MTIPFCFPLTRPEFRTTGNVHLFTVVFLDQSRRGEKIFVSCRIISSTVTHHTSQNEQSNLPSSKSIVYYGTKTASISIVWPASLIGVSIERNSCSEGSHIHSVIKRTVKVLECFWLRRPWPSLDVSLPAGCVTLRGWMLRAGDFLVVPCCYWSVLLKVVNQLATYLHLYLDRYVCAVWHYCSRVNSF